MILKLKLIALEVSHQMIDNKNRHEFSNSIRKEILDANLKIGYSQILHLNNGVMHSKFFDKRDKTWDSFNIQMLFSWYFLRAKISDKEGIKEQNIIQLSDTQSIFFEASKVVKMSLFNLLKSKHSNFRFKDDNSYLKKEEFETDVLSFYESCSSHIEIIVPNNKLADPSIHDPFLNFQINNSYQVGEENQAVAMKRDLWILCKTWDSFNIQMLFSWYFLRAKISDKEGIKEQNIIQLSDTQSIFFFWSFESS